MKTPAAVRSYLKGIWEAAKKERKRAIVLALGQSPRGILLDCGCGDGGWTSTLLKPLQARWAVAMDILAAPLRSLAQSDGAIRPLCAQLNRAFPFQDESVDRVVSDQVIEHLIDLDTFVSEIYRILRPGGVAVISTENLAGAHNIAALLMGLQPPTGPHLSQRAAIGCHPVVSDLQEHYEKYPSVEQMPPHTKVIAYKSLAALFQAHGFRVESLWGTGLFPFPPWLARWLLRLIPWYAAFVTVKAVKPPAPSGRRTP